MMRWWIRNCWVRRAVYLAVTIPLAIFSVVSRPYVAQALILPHDIVAADGLGRFASVIGDRDQKLADMLAGGRPSTSLYLILARSDRVRELVVDRLKLVGGPSGYSSRDSAKRALGDKVRILLLLGNVIEIEATARDSGEAQRLVSAYVEAFGNVLSAAENQLGAGQPFPQGAIDPATSAHPLSLQIIDPTHLTSTRSYNLRAVSALLLLLVLALFTELYAPRTGLFDLDRRSEDV